MDEHPHDFVLKLSPTVRPAVLFMIPVHRTLRTAELCETTGTHSETRELKRRKLKCILDLLGKIM